MAQSGRDTSFTFPDISPRIIRFDLGQIIDLKLKYIIRLICQEIRGVIVILSQFGRLWSKSSAGILNSYSKDINRGYQGPVSSSVFCGPDFCYEYGARLTVCQAYQGSFRPRIHLERNQSTDVV